MTRKGSRPRERAVDAKLLSGKDLSGRPRTPGERSHVQAFTLILLLFAVTLAAMTPVVSAADPVCVIELTRGSDSCSFECYESQPRFQGVTEIIGLAASEDLLVEILGTASCGSALSVCEARAGQAAGSSLADCWDSQTEAASTAYGSCTLSVNAVLDAYAWVVCYHIPNAVDAPHVCDLISCAETDPWCAYSSLCERA